MPDIWKNTLYYGDNLDILRDHIKDASVDLIYLDPPFNSNRNYNVLFKDERGKNRRRRLSLLKTHGIGIKRLKRHTIP
jgi:site-specific DNA-methyltransferase (adenine-specific)